MSYSELDSHEANAKLSEFHIVDVRQAHEFGGPLGQIEGAQLVPLGTISEKNDELTGSRPILFVCRSGVRSAMACELLQKRGIADVTNLKGGMIGWNQAGLSITRRSQDSLDTLVKAIATWLAMVSRQPVDEALSQIDVMLQEAGASLDAPSAQATGRLLEMIAAKLNEAEPPPDLALTLSAFRSDLADF